MCATSGTIGRSRARMRRRGMRRTARRPCSPSPSLRPMCSRCATDERRPGPPPAPSPTGGSPDGRATWNLGRAGTGRSRTGGGCGASLARPSGSCSPTSPPPVPDRCVIGVISAQNPDNATIDVGNWTWGTEGVTRGGDDAARRGPAKIAQGMRGTGADEGYDGSGHTLSGGHEGAHMGFIQAFKGAVGGVLTDQWKDFLTVPGGLPQTAALFPAVPQGTNAGRGANTRGSANVITNGSKILVPQGYGLITVVDGRATGLITEAGGYEFNDQSPDARSVFAGDEFLASTVGTSWERFKFGGRPSSQQLAFYVSLKEIPDNRFGTQSEIYWDDAYLNTQVGAVCRGSYTMRIIDPLQFVLIFDHASFISSNVPVFEFGDIDNAVGRQLSEQVVSSRAHAFSRYTTDPDQGNRVTAIQGDSVGFAQSLSAAVEESYRWSTDRGLAIVKTSIVSIEYDKRTRELLADVQKADALSGNRSQSFINQAVARGVQSAGQDGGRAGLATFGTGAGSAGALVHPLQPWGQGDQQAPQQQPPQGQPQPQAPQSQPQQAPQGGGQGEGPVAKLGQYKQMLNQGLITEADYEAAKKNALGL